MVLSLWGSYTILFWIVDIICCYPQHGRFSIYTELEGLSITKLVPIFSYVYDIWIIFKGPHNYMVTAFHLWVKQPLGPFHT